MTPSKSVLVVASLASTLMPPGIARAFVLAVLLSLLGMAAWIATSPGVVAGLVTETLQSGPGAPVLATVASPTGEQAVQLAAEPAAMPVPGDLILASGAPNSLDGIGAFVAVTHQTVLPLATWRADGDALLSLVPLDRVHPAVLIVVALLLVLFAPLALRALAAIGMAALSAAGVAGLWHLNLLHVMVPLPAGALDPLILGGAIIGAVAAWKVTGVDPVGLGQRFGAVVLVPGLLTPLGILTGLSPAALLLALLLLAVLWPTLILVAAALPLIAMALSPTPIILGAVALGLAAVRLWRDGRRGPTSVAAPMPRHDLPLDTDDRGAFDLARFVTGRPER